MQRQNAQHSHHVVVVDDEAVTRGLVSSHFEKQGYRVSEAQDARELEALLVSEPIDLVILDIVLPGKDGLSVTRELRARSNIGIVLISQRGDDVDRIIGLEIGADDYVSKPFNVRELVARAGAVIRRIRDCGTPNDESPVIRFARCAFDLNSRTVTAPSGAAHRLTAGEFGILTALVQNPGKVMARERLLDDRRNAALLTTRTVDMQIGRLRRKLEDDPRNPQLILTVHGEGYIFAGQPY